MKRVKQTIAMLLAALMLTTVIPADVLAQREETAEMRQDTDAEKEEHDRIAENREVMAVQSFAPRTSCPDTSDAHYFSSANPFYPDYAPTPGTIDALGNCTWYAWGRAYEILGTKPQLSTSNAGDWYAYNRDGGYYDYSNSVPKVGAIACWSNHVAVVEQVHSDGTIMISESSYKIEGVSDGFRFATRDNLDGASPYNYGAAFQGYIYLGDYATGEVTSGSYKGLNWSVTENGILTISGTATEPFDTESNFEGWISYVGKYTAVPITEVIVDISGENIYSTAYWFKESGVSHIESIVFKHIDTSQVTNMEHMFDRCAILDNLDVSGFDTSKVTNMSGMFYHCWDLQNLDVSCFDTSRVTNMSSMFVRCDDLQSLDVSNFDTSQVTDMEDMFSLCTHLQSLHMSGFDTRKVTTMSGMFDGCGSLQNLDVSSFDTSKVIDMTAMFGQCYSLQSINVRGFDTSKVTDMRFMFDGCGSLQSLDVSNFDTSQVTDMSWMFSGCKSLQNLDVRGFDTSKVIDMTAMFSGCYSLQNLDVSGFDTSQVTDMCYMFSGCKNLQNLDVSGFDTSQVTCMRCVFSDCKSMQNLDVSGFDTSQVIYMGCMFSNCERLQTLDLSHFDMKKVEMGWAGEGLQDMLQGMNELQSLKTPINLSRSISFSEYGQGNKYVPFSMYDSAGNEYTELPKNTSESITLYRNYEDIPEDLKLGIDQGTQISKAQMSIRIVDQNKSPLKNATVTYRGNKKTTNDQGVVKFSNYQKGNDLYIKSADGQTRTIRDFVREKSGETVYVFDTRFNAITFRLNDRNTDLLTKSKSINIKYKDTRFDLLVDCADPHVTGLFLYTGKKEVAVTYRGKFENLRYGDFQKGKDVMLKAYDIYGKLQWEKKLDLEVNLDDSTPSSISMGENLVIKIGSGVPLIGGTELEVLFMDLPVSYEESDGKRKATIGFEFLKAKKQSEEAQEAEGEGKDEKGDKKKDIFETFKKLKSGTYSHFLDKFRKGEAERKDPKDEEKSPFKFTINGYAEGPIDDPKGATKGKIYVELEVKMGEEKQYVVATVPIVVETKFSGKANGGVEFEYTDEGGLAANMIIGAEAALSVYGGVGVANLASAGVYGSGKMACEWTLLPISEKKVNEAYIQGKAGLQVKLFGKVLGKLTLINGKYYFVRKDTSHAGRKEDAFSIDYNTVYPNALSGSGGIWNPGGNGVHACGFVDENVLQNSVSAELDPKIVSTDQGVTMLTYLSNLDGRTDGNKSTLMYSLFDEADGTWSSPQPVFDNGTADFNPDFYSDGETIYAVWQDADTPLEDGLTLNQIADRLDLTVAKYVAEKNSFEVIGTITGENNLLPQQPQIAAQKDTIKVFWHENETDNVLGLSGTNRLYSAVLSGEDTLSVMELQAEEDISANEAVKGDAGESVVSGNDISGNSVSENDLSGNDNDVSQETAEADVYADNQDGQADWKILCMGETTASVLSADAGEYEGELCYAEAEGTLDQSYNIVSSDIALWNPQGRRAVHSGAGTNVQFGTLFGRKTVTWYEQGDIIYLDADSQAVPLFGESRIEGVDYAILADASGNPSVIYAQTGNDSSQLYQINYRENEGFSSSVCLTSQEQYIQNVEGFRYGNGWKLVYNKMEVEELEEKTNGLCTGYVDEEITDVALSQVSCTDYWDEAVGKQKLQTDLTVDNQGTADIPAWTLSLKDAEGTVLYTHTVEEVLKAGESSVFTKEFDAELIPAKGTYTWEITPVSGEVNADNNVFAVELGASCLSVTTKLITIESDSSIQISIQNTGLEACGGVLKVFDYEKGTEYLSQDFDPIEGGSSLVYNCDIPATAFEKRDSRSFTVQVIPAIEQENTELLTESLTVKAPEFTVAFMSEEEPQYVYGIPYGHTVAFPANPRKAGSYFVGWFTTEGELYTEETRIKGNVTLQAVWQEEDSVVDLEQCSVDPIADQLYTGKTLKPAVCVKHGSLLLKNGRDYTVSYGKNTEQGKGTVTITGKGSYTGSISRTFKIYYDITKASAQKLAAFAYTGSEITPEVVLAYQKTKLRKGVDYTLSYNSNTDAGTACITVTGKGKYTGSKKLFFTIKGIAISGMKIEKPDAVTYTGSEQVIAVTVTDKSGEELKQGQDYQLFYQNNEKVGSATITVVGKGNYTGSRKLTFKILPAQLEQATVTIPKTFSYTGKAWKPEPEVTWNQITLKEKEDYTVSYKNNMKAGTATLTLTGKGNYKGKIVRQFVIEPLDLSKTEGVRVEITDMAYTGKDVKPGVTVYAGSRKLSAKDYRVTFSDNKEIGEGQAVISGTGNYTGTLRADFRIVEKAQLLKNCKVEKLAPQTYTGTALTPDVVVRDGEKVLAKDVDYTLSYENNNRAGKAAVLIRGIGQYAGTQKVSFKILAKPLADKQGTLTEGLVIAPVGEVLYTGGVQTPGVELTDHGTLLEAGTDYVLKYQKNVKPGTALITITGKGNYSGKTTASFTIAEWDFTQLDAVIADQIYNGKAQKPVPEFTLNGEKLNLKAGAAYTIKYTNNKEVGYAQAVITGKGIFAKAQPITLRFYINCLDIEDAVIGNIPNQVFKGTDVTPIPKVKVGKLTLTYNKDFTVKYANNKRKGEATMIITGKGNFTGICEKRFYIQ